MIRQESECPAIVLASLEHGESDKIITLLTPSLGRVTGIAKGASRSKKRFVNKLELFTSLRITLSRKQPNSLAFLHDAELIESFIRIRGNVHVYAAASLMRETILAGTLDGQGDEETFTLLSWALRALDTGHDVSAVLAIFLIRYFDSLGYCPDLTSCRHCGKTVDDGGTFFFHHTLGSLFCNNCSGNDERFGSRNEMTPGTIRILTSALTVPVKRLQRLRFSQTAAEQALAMLQRYSKTIFQHDMMSWKALTY